MIRLVLDVVLITKGDEMILTAPYVTLENCLGEPLSHACYLRAPFSVHTLVIHDLSRDTIPRSDSIKVRNS